MWAGLSCESCGRTAVAETPTGALSWLTEHLATHRLAERFPSLLWGEREWLLLLTVRDDIFTAICDGITEVTARYLAAPDRAAWCERQHVDKATISLLRRADELLGAA